MMFKFYCFSFLLLLSLEVFAEEGADFGNIYRNTREGKSIFITDLNSNEILQIKKNQTKMKALRDIFSSNEINTCASKIIQTMKLKLNLSGQHEVEVGILALRSEDFLDDISTGILLKSNQLVDKISFPIAKDSLSSDDEDAAVSVFKTHLKSIRNNTSCVEDNFRDLVFDLESHSSKNKDNLKHIFKLALNEDLITRNQFKSLDKMRENKVHLWPMSLKEYHSKLSYLRSNFPNYFSESSSVMTDLKLKQKISFRQGLFEKFSGQQIIILSNLVSELKNHLNSKEITINIEYPDRPDEIINLGPMEKFRFILKLLRKELAAVNNGTILDGRQASFYDLIAASYEVGETHSNEIEQLLGLQEIWNPVKTPKQKAMFWANSFGGIASVLLPPPYGFLSVMAIMLIDQQVKDAAIDRDADYNLF